MNEPDRIRASDQERDVAATRLQVAFGEGRLGDAEFDTRMRAALTAQTRADLAELVRDLPAESSAPLPVPTGGRGGRLAMAYKSSVRRGGRWRVPDRYTTVVYKGSGWLDLRGAELTSPVTTIRAIGYKSRIDILVPPGVRVEADGLGISAGAGDGDAPLSANAPVVHVHGYAYKGCVEVSSHPPES
ncbi:MAG TPA: DUF1707 domain-containing protein [Streptosporangiaceae bacterium]|jgi:hypothetical protein